jgi:hypothetical protein
MLGGPEPAGLPVARLVNPVLTRAITVATAVDTPQSPQLLAVKQLLLSILEQQPVHVAAG